MNKFKTFTALMLLLAIGFAGCGKSEAERHRLSKKEKARLDSLDRAALKIAVMPTMDCLPIFLACDDSIFQQQGVDVHLRRYTAQMDCDTAIERKRVEGAVTDLIRAHHIEKRGTALTYPISTNLYWQFITNKRSRISELKQLSDKMVAMTRYSATDYLATLAIDSGKPKYDAYKVQINDLNIRLRMLLNNEMDAMLLPEPQATKARLEQHVKLFDSRDKNLQLGVVAFRKKILSEPRRKDQVAKFIKAYNIAVDEFFKLGEDNPVHNDEIEKKRKRNVHFKEAGNHLVEVFEAVYDFFSDRTRVRHHTESADFILSKAHSLLSYLEPTLVSFVQTHAPLIVPRWQSRARKSKFQFLSGAGARIVSALYLRLVAR